MKLEDVRMAIRPRGILECLDLTFLFCGRHWLGLFLTAVIGVLPISLFNAVIFTLPDVHPYGVYLLLVMEMPWATIFVTLYLGQITFSPRVHIRVMLMDAFWALFQLFLFQFLLRGLCMVVVVLCPVVFIGMYFLNEIILLEKPPLFRVWQRRTAMNARILGRILSLRVMDLLVLCGGTMGLSALFRAISALWEDKLSPLLSLYRYADSPLEMMVSPDWQLQLAFWVVIVFLTVFRFIAYLDCRIRREGWDVELKLRTQAAIYRERETAA